jgi:hypothetical protein
MSDINKITNATVLDNEDFLKVRNIPNKDATPKMINDIKANSANSSCCLIVASTIP